MQEWYERLFSPLEFGLLGGGRGGFCVCRAVLEALVGGVLEDLLGRDILACGGGGGAGGEDGAGVFEVGRGGALDGGGRGGFVLAGGEGGCGLWVCHCSGGGGLRSS